VSPSPDDPAALPGWAFGIGLAAAADWLEKKKKNKKSDFILLFTVFVSGEEGRGGDRNRSSQSRLRAAARLVMVMHTILLVSGDRIKTETGTKLRQHFLGRD
jgi:hypothetical protein